MKWIKKQETRKNIPSPATNLGKQRMVLDEME